jgi:flavin-dependent dehydrogenase
VHAGRVLLLGDASGYRDALTGEGLSIAFRQADALAEHLAERAPERYPESHRRIMRSYELLTSALLAAGDHPRLRRALVSGLSVRPALMSSVLTWTCCGPLPHAGPDPTKALHVVQRSE